MGGVEEDWHIASVALTHTHTQYIYNAIYLYVPSGPHTSNPTTSISVSDHTPSSVQTGSSILAKETLQVLTLVHAKVHVADHLQNLADLRVDDASSTTTRRTNEVRKHSTNDDVGRSWSKAQVGHHLTYSAYMCI